MQLEDSLRICLLAIESRYPGHVVDCNELVLGPQQQGAEGWSALELIDYLTATTPDLLEKQARLIVDIQKSEIYLVEHSEHHPALIVHCRGKMPVHIMRVPTQQLAQA